MTAGPLILLTTADCHMCEHARSTLDQLDLAWREVDAESAEGRRLAGLAPPLRPVLFDSTETVVAYGRLSARRIARDMRRGRIHAIPTAGSPRLHGAA